jgi:hypothetical protein
MNGVPVSTPLDPALQQIVIKAREDLAKRLALSVDQINLVELRSVVWSDTSLGCPLPGMMYAQVVTAGYRIVLAAGDQTHEYHSDTQRVVYCASQAAQPLLGKSTEGVQLAKEDLARRLGVSVESITVDAVIGQEFSTEAFYCRTTKDRIARDESPAVISGESILLSASGRRYEYHANGPTVVFCRPLS